MAIPPGRNFQDSVSIVPVPTAARVKPQRTYLPPTTQANPRPRSASTTCERDSQVRCGSSLRPVNHAPTRPLSASVVPPPRPTNRAPHAGAGDVGDQVVEHLGRRLHCHRLLVTADARLLHAS